MPTPAEYQARRRARRRAEGKLPPITPPKWSDAHPVTSTVGVPQVVKDYLTTPEGRQAVLRLATYAPIKGHDEALTRVAKAIYRAGLDNTL